MPDRQVRVDLVAQDDASSQIRDVAKEAGKLEDLDPTVEVQADTKPAQRSVDDLIRTVEQLTDEDATIVLAMRAGQVQRDLTETLLKVEQLDQSDPEVQVQLAHAADVRDDLDKLEGKIKDLNATPVDVTGISHLRDETGKAKDTMHGFVGNAIAELPGVSTAFGPLGEAASQMTEGLLAGEVAMGGLAAAALPIAGIAGGMMVLSKVLQDNKRRAEEARKRVEEYTKALIEARDEGTDAFQAIDDVLLEHLRNNQKLVGSVDDVNLTYDDLQKMMDGDVTPAMQRVLDVQREYNDAAGDAAQANARAEPDTGIWEDHAAAVGMTVDQFRAFVEDADKVTGFLEDEGVAVGKSKDEMDQYNRVIPNAKTGTKNLGDAADVAAGQIDGAAEAIEHSNEALDDMLDALDIEKDVKDLGGTLVEQMANAKKGVKATDDELWTMKKDVGTIAKEFNRSPLELQTALDAIDRGDFQAVWNMVQGWMNQQTLHQPVQLDVHLDRSSIADFLSAQGITLTGTGVPSGRAAPAGAVIVNQTFPRGYRSSSAIAEAQRAAGRAGKLYMRGHVPR